MTTTSTSLPSPVRRRRPNPQALNEFLDRYLWWQAKRELAKRSGKRKTKHATKPREKSVNAE